MQRDFVPIQVIEDGKTKIWQMDVTNLNTLELIKLKKTFEGTEFSPTMSVLDKMIYTNMDEFRGTKNVFGKGRLREEKKESKIQKKVKKKVRRYK